MDLFAISSVVIVLAAAFGYINVRFLKLPNTIGSMLVAIVFTGLLIASSFVTDQFLEGARSLIRQIDFKHVLLDVLLGFMLFAGAMHTNFDQLRVQRWPVLVFSTLGILSSTFLAAVFVYVGFRFINLEPKFIHCLLFGALISPTDPIAVLGILKQAGVPKKLETKIVGESLFNDGVGVVVFVTILSIATGGANHTDSSHADQAHGTVVVVSSVADTVTNVLSLFGQEVFGGIILGLSLGYLTFLLLKSIDNYEVEVMITLACVMGGCAMAQRWHLSAPLAMVVAGLIVGNDTVRGTAMSRETEHYVDQFWELIDMLMNAILFVLIGLELLLVSFKTENLIAAAIAIIVVLVARFLSLLIPVRFFANRLQFVPHTTTIMTWGGLRGGISIALALVLDTVVGLDRELFLTVTYAVVVFSIVVQGLTVGRLASRLIGNVAPVETTNESSH